MEENDKPIKPDGEEPTPDVARLMKILEMQSAAHRVRGERSAFQAPGFKYGVLLAIVIFALGSLGILEWFLSQLPRPAHANDGVRPGASVTATP